ncbi:NAD(P)H-binding protein [Mesorhizobium sp. M0129]|uniref:NAD(P)H-binding protein n=1 Tax=Mesorhizobium sp. M0129 TaxID=2956886 RepID=UPI00333668C3
MHVILGGTGHVGSAAAMALLRQGEDVTVVTRDESKAAWLVEQGAEAAVADVLDVEALREVLRRGKRAFLLNPPADPSTDTDAEERKTVGAIAAALEGSGLEKLVVESTYGAQAGEGVGDLTVLYGLEQKLKAQAIPASINRAAYYMSNWDQALETARRWWRRRISARPRRDVCWSRRTRPARTISRALGATQPPMSPQPSVRRCAKTCAWSRCRASAGQKPTKNSASPKRRPSPTPA